MHKSQSLINHVALVLDASWSMKGRERAVAKVVNEQVKHLNEKSKELHQETRVSVYRFGETTIECLIFDMDVARLPSADDLYAVLYENTALIDATLKSQEDLETTSQLYGDHAFLTFVMTDGQENRSRRSKEELKRKLMSAGVNWSVGFLVPDRTGQQYMEALGVLSDSIAIWDTTSAVGLNSAASAIRTATDNFMTARTKGVRGTRSVFGTGLQHVNEVTVPQALEPLASNKFDLLSVTGESAIRPFVERRLNKTYTQGMAYYQLTKTETIQARKQIIVVEKATGKAYGGQNARDLLGLPHGKETRVKPDYNPKYDIYVQSTSVNRKLVPNTKLLVTS